ncbi:hypothetical protein KSC_045950 [Ktedonobacter sp. SOSP1-52]|uniref:DUF2079 domain-containing protein n=1 Tax=Ktedonobacter sp. SOSP1-52 TaxID=2778366 RepID=UPI001A2BDCA1|nr:DUF2079 domain-containing protein [Ktedonobacter sp. SOSP1-52]GHO65703.1 hypothetical protein KSC_045950 [Ktedonobacter sp. SOSP1-52]
MAIALLYLLYPAQQQATIYDFHAVTLTTSLLLFTFYFMYTRRTAPMFVFALLSMACKEEIPLVIAMFCLWSMVFQRRWRSSAILLVIALAWFGIAYYYVFPHFSPTGKPLLSGRYDGASQGTTRDFLHKYLLDSKHRDYLKILLEPAVFLPVLAPWVLVLAAPTLALNLLSSHEGQYSGLFQYNAEIVPVLIFATIEALVLLLWLIQLGSDWLNRRKAQAEPADSESLRPAQRRKPRLAGRLLQLSVMTALLCVTLFSSLRTDYYFHGALPFSVDFHWPQISARTQLLQKFIDMVPPDASISAQTRLVPHLSQRQKIYMFPYANDQADYVLLDLQGDFYPFYGSDAYSRSVKSVLLSGKYGIVKAEDGMLLLKKGLPAPGLSPLSPVQAGPGANLTHALPNLPASLCADTLVSPQEMQQIQHPLQATFSAGNGSLQLLGYDATLNSKYENAKTHQYDRTDVHATISTYWKVVQPIRVSQQIAFIMETSDGQEHLSSTDVPLLNWCQSNTWKPGDVIKMQSNNFFLLHPGSPLYPKGLAHLSIALLPLAQPSSTIMDVQARLHVDMEKSQDGVEVNQNARLLRLFALNLI